MVAIIWQLLYQQHRYYSIVKGKYGTFNENHTMKIIQYHENRKILIELNEQYNVYNTVYNTPGIK